MAHTKLDEIPLDTWRSYILPFIGTDPESSSRYVPLWKMREDFRSMLKAFSGEANLPILKKETSLAYIATLQPQNLLRILPNIARIPEIRDLLLAEYFHDGQEQKLSPHEQKTLIMQAYLLNHARYNHGTILINSRALLEAFLSLPPDKREGIYDVTISDDVHLQDADIPNLRGFPIRRLNLYSSSELTNQALANLAAISLPLEDLDLSHCTGLRDEGLQYLAALPLKSLKIKSCDTITDGGLEFLSACRTLESLSIWACHQITGNGLRAISNLPLRTLNLKYCSGITNAALSLLSSFTKLQTLTCSIRIFDEQSLNSISRLSTLQTLNLEGCTFPPTGIHALSALHALRRLNLDGCKELTDGNLAEISTLPLTDLNVTDCARLTNVGLQALSAMPLESLRLQACRAIDDRGISNLSRLPLVSLDLYNCPRVTSASLRHLSTLPLRSLDVRDTSISAGEVEKWVQTSPALANQLEIKTSTDFRSFTARAARQAGTEATWDLLAQFSGAPSARSLR